jgi:hypothetical protein
VLCTMLTATSMQQLIRLSILIDEPAGYPSSPTHTAQWQSLLHLLYAHSQCLVPGMCLALCFCRRRG